MSIVGNISRLSRTRSTGAGLPPSGGSISETFVDLHVLAGQSNLGRSILSEMTTGQNTTYGGAITGMNIYQPLYNAAFTTLQAGTNTFLNNYMNLTEFGPEVSLAKSLKDYGKNDVYFVKVGYGNTDLPSYWLPGGSWELVLKTNIDKAIQLIIAAGKKPKIKSFIWMQGENDATNATWAANYQTNLTRMFSDFDIWLQNKIVQYSLPNYQSYRKVIGRINGINDASEVYRATVRTAQANYCAIPANNASLIDTDSYPFKDYVHYSATGQIQFGIDIFNIIKDL